MNVYRMELIANGFTLNVFYGETEKRGLTQCKEYASGFQRKVSNVELKVVIQKREKQQTRSHYKNVPWEYYKTLTKKPLKTKEKNPPE